MIGLLLLALFLNDIGAITSALRDNEFAKAHELAQQELRQSPNDSKLWTLEGLALQGLGKQDTALAAFRNALKSSPDYLPALEGEAQIEYKSRVPQAPLTLQRILRLQPSNQKSHAMLAALSYAAGNCADAVRHYDQSRQAIASEPTALTQYGWCLVETGKPQTALPVLQRVVAMRPDAPHAFEARMLDLESAAYEASGDTPNAVSTLRSAIVEDPRQVALYLDFASLCFDHQSFQVGVDVVSSGIQRVPDSAKLYVARGILLVQLGKYDAAERDFSTAERLDPKHSFGPVAESLSQLQENKPDQALASAQRQIEKNPSDSFSYYLQGETLRQMGEMQRAIASAKRAIALKPDFPLAEDLLGSLYLQSGKLDLAMQQFQSALRHDPLNQSALYHMLVAARKTGRTGLLPGLLKRLAQAKQEAQKRDEKSSRYRLVEDAESR